MVEQPPVHQWRLVNARVVEHEVGGQPVRDLVVDGVEEGFELGGSVPAMGVTDDFAARHIYIGMFKKGLDSGEAGSVRRTSG